MEPNTPAKITQPLTYPFCLQIIPSTDSVTLSIPSPLFQSHTVSIKSQKQTCVSPPLNSHHLNRTTIYHLSSTLPFISKSICKIRNHCKKQHQLNQLPTVSTCLIVHSSTDTNHRLLYTCSRLKSPNT